MQTAITLMSSVANGKKPVQLICSPSGFGKTSIAKAECQRRGIRFERPEDRVPAMQRALRGIASERTRWKLAIETRPKKVISLVRVLYRCSVLNTALLLFDDPGRVAQNEDACDILRTCLGVQRMVMYETPEITRNYGNRAGTAGTTRSSCHLSFRCHRICAGCGCPTRITRTQQSWQNSGITSRHSSHAG
jgi:hypothetical protein